jgi:pyruvate kinase
VGRKVNTNKSFPCAPVLTEEDIEWLEFGFEEWVDALEQIDGKGKNKNDDIRK